MKKKSLLPKEKKILLPISEADMRMLVEMGKNFYVIPGEPSESPEAIVHQLIAAEWDRYEPPEYRTTGFDRQ